MSAHAEMRNVYMLRRLAERRRRDEYEYDEYDEYDVALSHSGNSLVAAGLINANFMIAISRAASIYHNGPTLRGVMRFIAPLFTIAALTMSKKTFVVVLSSLATICNVLC